MAARLKEELGVEARQEAGGLGEFTVLVDGQVVSKKWLLLRPSDENVVAAVKRALGNG